MYPYIVLNYYKCGYQTVCGSFRSLFLAPLQLLTYNVYSIYSALSSFTRLNYPSRNPLPPFKNILSQISNYFPSNFVKRNTLKLFEQLSLQVLVFKTNTRDYERRNRAY